MSLEALDTVPYQTPVIPFIALPVEPMFQPLKLQSCVSRVEWEPFKFKPCFVHVSVVVVWNLGFLTLL